MEQRVKEFETLSELLEDLDREGITGYQRKRIVERFLMLRSRISGHPFAASFELTPICNFDCKMCYVHLDKKQIEKCGEILTTEEWLDIARQAADAGIMYADLTGGECLMHPGFKQIYMYLQSRGVRVSVLTNGALIDDEMIDFFTINRPAAIQITVYGSCPEAYVKVTGRDAYNDVISAIERLKQAKLNVKLAMTPSKYMQDDATALLHLFHSLNVQYGIGTGTMIARPETERDYHEFVADYEVCADLLDKDEAYKRELKSFEGSKKTPYEFRIKDMECIKGMPCAGGSASFHINWRGEMTPCIPLYTVAKSVRHGEFIDAWLWIRSVISTYSLPKECQECVYEKVCTACPAERTSCELQGVINRYVCKKCEHIVRTMHKRDGVSQLSEIKCDEI